MHWPNFGELIQNLYEQQEFLSVTEMVEEVLEKTGYEEMLKREQSLESQSRLENLEEFLRLLKNLKKQVKIRL